MSGGGRIEVVDLVGDAFADYIRANATYCRSVVQEHSARGQHLVIAGAGPSLADNVQHCTEGDQVWATNGALPWLLEHHHRVTHGFTVNHFPAMLDLWRSAPALEYLLASTVDPALSELLATAGRCATYFHNAVRLEQQDALYVEHYPPTICAGSGLNAVTRALDVAAFMGFDRVTVIGADSCLGIRAGAPSRASVYPGTPAYDAWLRDFAIMHVTGESPIEGGCSPLTLSGVIDGREWVAQPDMWISANWATRMERASRGVIRFVGDGLVAALRDKPTSFLDRLPMQIWDSTGEVVKIPF